MAAYENIVCATDLSAPSDEALRQAFTLSEASGARLAVVLAATYAYGLGGGAPIPPLAQLLDPEQFKRHTSAAIREQMARIHPGGEAEVVVRIEERSDTAAIVQFAESRKAGLIVVGSKGATGLRRMALGSVAESVVRHAHCPVLVARPSPSNGQVLVATDLSEASLLAISAAYAVAQRRQGKLTVLHCMDFPPNMLALGFGPLVPADPEDPHSRVALAKQAEAHLRDLLASLCVVADIRVDPGRALAAIPDVAEQLPAELVVVGSHGKTGFKRMLLGSVAESVVRHAPCSVLVVRAG
jgi:nucleotide-binding universal stress UspA family protein